MTVIMKLMTENSNFKVKIVIFNSETEQDICMIKYIC